MNEISIYQTESGALEIRMHQDTVWLTQTAGAGVHAVTVSKMETVRR